MSEPLRPDTYCESCLVSGISTPATTRSTHPDWAGYALCQACAEEYDGRPPATYHPENTEETDHA